MFKGIIQKVLGSKADRDFKKYHPRVEEIRGHAESYKSFSEEDFKAKSAEFKERYAAGETLDDLLPEAFGLVIAAETSLVGKTWDVCGIDIKWEMVPYDVQLVGGMVLHSGSIAEMATGEGKTLVATMPLYLNALAGKGAHLVTVNDYLARRDAEWMGPVYELLGMTVGVVQSDVSNDQRKAAYAADITYGTNNEFGFDYLRDNMKTRLEDKVQRPHFYAIVDEVDSVLIDEARTPLIISGPVAASKSSDLFAALRPHIERAVRQQDRLMNELMQFSEKHLDSAEHEEEVGRALLKVHRGDPKNKRLLKMRKEAGIDQVIHGTESDLMRDKSLHLLDEELFFAIDEKGHSINLTDKGREAISPEDREQFVLPDLSEVLQKIDDDESLSPEDKVKEKDAAHRQFAEKSESIHNFNQLLKAYTLFEKDVEYVVQEGKVVIVDEHTGRLMPGRRFSDGLHQALEAKERVKIEGETQTLATVTLQNYFRMYDKLAGMTGTAVTEATEFGKIYKLDVNEIPTNEPIRRMDFDDRIYGSKREKYNAIVDEIARLNANGLPVLVGTISVETSELLSRILKRRGIKHNVLNAKFHQKEAEIVQLAGKAGAVTIATNMAGRGTDIKLDPTVMKCAECGIHSGKTEWQTKDGQTVNPVECEEDVPCGLHIIGSERHESRRIDRQLRGRAGRQGDPGASLFFMSLEDDLMRLFGKPGHVNRLKGLMEEDQPISYGIVTKAIERAQRRVETYNFDIRKRLIDYDDVMNKQREVIYARRDEIMTAENLNDIIAEMMEDTIEARLAEYIDPKELPENWPLTELLASLESTFLYNFPMPEGDIEDVNDDDLRDYVTERSKEAYAARERFLEEQLGSADVVREFEKYVLLQTIDERWMDHLHELDYLKEGIHFRAYAQKDPLIEYKKEAFGLFAGLNETIDNDALHAFFHARIATRQQQGRELAAAKAVHQEAAGAYSMQEPAMATTPAHAEALKQPQGKAPQVRDEEKVGRNDPCPCGSGKKYKKCHGAR